MHCLLTNLKSYLVPKAKNLHHLRAPQRPGSGDHNLKNAGFESLLSNTFSLEPMPFQCHGYQRSIHGMSQQFQILGHGSIYMYICYTYVDTVIKPTKHGVNMLQPTTVNEQKLSKQTSCIEMRRFPKASAPHLSGMAPTLIEILASQSFKLSVSQHYNQLHQFVAVCKPSAYHPEPWLY